MRKQPRIVGIFSLLFMSFALSVILGCASQVPILVENLNTESSCCSNYAEFQFEDMPIDKEIKFSIGPGDKAYLFPTGKSYFKSFRLPEFEDTHSLQIRTYLQGTSSENIYVFAPFLTFLNDSYTPLDDAKAPKLYFDEGFIEGKRWTAVIDLPQTAKYVVIHTHPELINKRIELGPSGSTGLVVALIESYSDRSAAYGPAGTLKVSFLPKIK